MADKTIGSLPEALTITNQDLFVVEQSSTAKKVTGSTFLAMVQAHGGIASVTQNADYTLTFTFADGTTWTTPTPVRGAQGEQGETGETGNGIESITKTGTAGRVDTYTIAFTDGSSTTFTVTNGEKGDTGDTGNGIASTTLNADYTLTITYTDGTTYTTGSIRGQKGNKGDTGDDASVSVTEYGQSSSPSTQPTTWTTTIPTVAGGDYLWTRFTWNNGEYSYTVARQGVDGQGSGDMLKSVYSPNYTGELASNADLTSHTSDTTIHVTSADKTAWNAKADKGVSFTVTLTTSGWSSNEQTVSDVRIVASGYDYIVSPQDTSYGNYASAMVYAEDITTDGQITFKCAETPSSNLTVNILRIEVA